MTEKNHAAAARAEMVRAAPGVLTWLEDKEDDRISLSMIRVPRPDQRKGYGNAAMAALTAYADAHGLRLSLTPDNGFGTPLTVLIPFYHRHGFRKHRDARVLDTHLRLPLQ